MPATEWGWLISHAEIEGWMLGPDHIHTAAPPATPPAPPQRPPSPPPPLDPGTSKSSKARRRLKRSERKRPRQLDRAALRGVVALNKPGLVVCHPSKRGPWSSLVGAYRALHGPGPCQCADCSSTMPCTGDPAHHIDGEQTPPPPPPPLPTHRSEAKGNTSASDGTAPAPALASKNSSPSRNPEPPCSTNGPPAEQSKVHLVSRLDRETSGVVLFARGAEDAWRFKQAFVDGLVTKLYVAVLEGCLRAPVVEEGGLRRPSTGLLRSRVEVVPAAVGGPEGGGAGVKAAKTLFTPLHVAESYTLALVRPVTGRYHQIRAHAMAIGHSVVADKVYGPGGDGLFLEFAAEGWTPQLASQLPCERHLLHAARLAFDFPDGRQTFVAPILPDMAAFCAAHLGLDAPTLSTLVATALR